MRTRRKTAGALAFLMISALVILAFTATHAQGTAVDPEIAKKLDDILSNQKTILQGVESLKAELNIIKIRITQQQ